MLQQIIKKLFRIVEIFLILVFVCIRLPFAVKTTGDYFRQLISVIISPLFIFLIANVIVILLFFNSRRFFSKPEHSQISIQSPHSDFCQEFITTNWDDAAHSISGLRNSLQQEEVIVFQDKQTVLQVTKVEVYSSKEQGNEDNYSGGETVDELSNEEFHRAIEDFIAKQIKFHQQEKHSIVQLHEI